MKILVTGKDGQLGKSIHKIVDRVNVSNNKPIHEFVFVGRNELDFGDKEAIENFLSDNNFDVIINCAAYTAVDKAESQKFLANQINNLAVKQIAQLVSNTKTKLIHISTDYVFDGESDAPYVETDKTNPINVYGCTKLAGEQSIQNTMPNNAIIIRTSWVYSEYGNNFVNTMLNLGSKREEVGVISDQIGSPTYASDLAKAILVIVDSQSFVEKSLATQVYHYSNKGKCSWYEFAQEIFDLTNIKCSIKPIISEEYLSQAERPKNTLMNQDKILKEFDLNTPPWKESLARCIG